MGSRVSPSKQPNRHWYFSKKCSAKLRHSQNDRLRNFVTAVMVEIGKFEAKSPSSIKRQLRFSRNLPKQRDVVLDDCGELLRRAADYCEPHLVKLCPDTSISKG